MDSTLKKLASAVILLLLFEAESFPQPEGFDVMPVTFSSRINNEFSPFFYRGGIVFCSDERDNSLASYTDNENSLFKIFIVFKRGNSGWTQPRLFAKEISTSFNDGPATFSETGDTIYYSRNNSIENSLKNIYDTLNKLGIYSAELIDGRWTNVAPFEYNDTRYSFTTPSLAPDGKRLYFSSDMPGGYGRMDLYYCQRRNNGWDKPVNLGPVINTPGNESFPFASNYDKIYFASDGLNGFGGKDLYYTQQINGEWINPVHLDSAINSAADDFGIVTDSTFQNGFFSSNRLKTDDIYSFSLPPVRFDSCDSMHENNYCFTLYDENQKMIDTIQALYTWDFGDGIILNGREVKHCFPGPGEYSVKLTITDELTGDTISDQVEYKVDIENIRQALIKSPDVGVVDRPVSFEGVIQDLKSPGITDFYWDLGDGFNPGGSMINHAFKKKGDYTVRLGLLFKKDSLGRVRKVCVMKKLTVFNSYRELIDKDEKNGGLRSDSNKTVLNPGNILRARVFLMDEISGQQRSGIEKSFRPSGEQSVIFDKYGISSVSFPLLDKVAGILNDNPDLKLDIDIHAVRDDLKVRNIELSEIWVQELLFYLRGKNIEAVRLHGTGFGPAHQMLAPFVPEDKSVDGVIEFIFTRI